MEKCSINLRHNKTASHQLLYEFVNDISFTFLRPYQKVCSVNLKRKNKAKQISFAAFNLTYRNTL